MIGARGSASPEWIAEQATIAGVGGTPFGIGLMAWVPELSTQLEAIEDLTGDQQPALVSVSFGDLAEPVARLRDAGLRTACQVGNEADLHAAVAAGCFADIHAAASVIGAIDEGRFTPVPANVAAYDALYAEYRELHDHFGQRDTAMHRLRRIRRAALAGGDR